MVMAKGSLGRTPPVLAIENVLACFDPTKNNTLTYTPKIKAYGVLFQNASDNHVKVDIKLKDQTFTILLLPNSSEQYSFAKAVISEISLAAVELPAGTGSVVDASETETVAAALQGFVDINLISDA